MFKPEKTISKFLIMKFEKLIGFKLDTNQFTSEPIRNKEEAKLVVKKVIHIYGKEILKHMFLTNNKRYSTFAKKSVSLHEVLN